MQLEESVAGLEESRNGWSTDRPVGMHRSGGGMSSSGSSRPRQGNS